MAVNGPVRSTSPTGRTGRTPGRVNAFRPTLSACLIITHERPFTRTPTNAGRLRAGASISSETLARRRGRVGRHRSPAAPPLPRPNPPAAPPVPHPQPNSQRRPPNTPRTPRHPARPQPPTPGRSIKTEPATLHSHPRARPAPYPNSQNREPFSLHHTAAAAARSQPAREFPFGGPAVLSLRSLSKIDTRVPHRS